jgi:hypothetical protein
MAGVGCTVYQQGKFRSNRESLCCTEYSAYYKEVRDTVCSLLGTFNLYVTAFSRELFLFVC